MFEFKFTEEQLMLREMVRDFAINELNETWSFFHITSSPYARGLEYSLKRMSEGWNRLNLRLKREYGTLSWVRVYEQHKDHTVHLHAVGSTVIQERWLKDNAWACKLGYMAKSGEMKGIRPAFYATKYMTKIEDEWPRGTRRIGASHHFPDNKKDTNDWELIRHSRNLNERDYFSLSNMRTIPIFDADWQRYVTIAEFEDGNYEE